MHIAQIHIYHGKIAGLDLAVKGENSFVECRMYHVGDQLLEGLQYGRVLTRICFYLPGGIVCQTVPEFKINFHCLPIGTCVSQSKFQAPGLT